MKNILLNTSAVIVFMYSTVAQSMDCAQFTASGISAKSVDDISKTSATSDQVQAFKKIIGDHVADLSGYGFSSRKKALKLVRKNKKLVVFVRESLILTRVECFLHKDQALKETSINQFNYLLDAVIKEHNL